MLFNSFPFLILVLLTSSFYYLPKFQTAQVPILIVASFVFYAWSSPSLPIPSVLIDFNQHRHEFQSGSTLAEKKADVLGDLGSGW